MSRHPIFFASLLFCLGPSAFGQNDLGPGRELLRRWSLRLPDYSQSYIVTTSITVMDPDGAKEESRARSYVYSEDKIITEVEGEGIPPDLVVLVLGNEAWVYKEGLRRPLKVKRDFDVAGSAGVGEIIGLNYWDDYRSVEEGSMGGDGYRMKMRAAEESSTYRYASLDFEKGQLKEVELQGVSGKAVKRVEIPSFNSYGSIEFPNLVITDLLFQRGTQTFVDSREVARAQLNPNLFRPNVLPRFFTMKEGLVR